MPARFGYRLDYLARKPWYSDVTEKIQKTLHLPRSHDYVSSQIRVLESPDDMASVEDLQRLVWPGSETEIDPCTPVDPLRCITRSCGRCICQRSTRWFCVWFPGIEFTPDGPRPKHCSHMLGDPSPIQRDSGLASR